MIAPSMPPLKEFSSDNEKLQYFRSWGLITQKAKHLVPVLYCGYYTDSAVPCEVIGRTWEDTAVILVKGQLHCIDGSYLAELQPKFKIYPRKSIAFSTFLSDYVVFDIETTGFSRQNDSIIEISAIRYSFDQKKDVFSSLIKNTTPIHSSALRVNHITQEMLQDAPSFEEVSARFFEFIGNLPLVGHNISSFDLPFLEESTGEHISNLYCDTCTLARTSFPGLPSYRLFDLAAALDLPCKPTHRALQDVEATAALFWRCVSSVKVPTEPEAI